MCMTQWFFCFRNHNTGSHSIFSGREIRRIQCKPAVELPIWRRTTNQKNILVLGRTYPPPRPTRNFAPWNISQNSKRIHLWLGEPGEGHKRLHATSGPRHCKPTLILRIWRVSKRRALRLPLFAFGQLIKINQQNWILQHIFWTTSSPNTKSICCGPLHQKGNYWSREYFGFGENLSSFLASDQPRL